MEKKPSIMNIRCVAFGLMHSEDEEMKNIGYVLEERIKDYDKAEISKVRTYILGNITGIIDVLFLKHSIPGTVFEDVMEEIKKAIIY